MIRGETVVVEQELRTGTAPGNTPIYEWVPETVDDVLVAPGAREDVVDSNRPEGVRVAWTLHFPKTFNASLRGARISVRGEEARSVIGDPKPYTLANTPTRWHMPVELEAVDG
ncbi:MAG: hypothetical protein ACTIJ6_05340 [Leucobacter sp.]